MKWKKSCGMFLLVLFVCLLVLSSVVCAQTTAAPAGGEKAQATKEDVLKLQLENVLLKYQIQGCMQLQQQAQGLEAQIKAAAAPAKAEPKKAK
jgi:surface antigen